MFNFTDFNSGYKNLHKGTVSTIVGSKLNPKSLQFLEIKLQSNPALCATTIESPINSKNLGKISSIDCASLTISSLIPVSSVILYGIGLLGFTNSLKLSTIAPF